MPDNLLFAIIGFAVVNIFAGAIVFQAVDWNNTKAVKRVFGYGFLLSLVAFVLIYIFWEQILAALPE